MGLSLSLALLTLPAGCAAPPVKLYTLGGPAIAAGAAPAADAPFAPSTPIVEVRRVALPDYLDTQDIVVRRGNQIDRSSEGRWSSRLSIGATDLIAARLAALRPDMLVTGQPQVTPPSFRLAIDISRLDVSASGTVALEANWTIVPKGEDLPITHGRASLSEEGAVATDEEVVALTDAILDRLAGRIVMDFQSVAAKSP
ncbi:MAG TPA: PqiC family protein [Aliidongia sp.]|nr:PqiC family protein [Aliidongia sp.]